MWGETKEQAIAAWNRRAAPKVKPLVWVKDEAITAIGVYCLNIEDRNHEEHFDKWYWYVSGSSRESVASYMTKESAKAAAQADYQRRILEVLE